MTPQRERMRFILEVLDNGMKEGNVPLLQAAASITYFPFTKATYLLFTTTTPARNDTPETAQQLMFSFWEDPRGVDPPLF